MKKFLIGLLIVIVGGYGVLKLSYPTYSWHHKLTVEVETPDGVVSGSSVVKVLRWLGDGSSSNAPEASSRFPKDARYSRCACRIFSRSVSLLGWSYAVIR